MKKLSLYLFIAASVAEVLSEIFTIPLLHQLSKPLIIVTLAVFYFYHSEYRSTVVWLALFFSFSGDVLLMFETERSNFFLFGLAAFLMAHIFYILAYRQHQDSSMENSLKGIQKIRFSFPIVLAGTGLIVILYPSLGPLKLPVVVYALILIIMVLNSIFRFGRTNNQSFWLVFAGSALFMLSDSLLAINKFFKPVPAAGFWIMSTYILAQFLIVKGLVQHVKQP
jgi:uncharacterized membrane protein YhhN